MMKHRDIRPAQSLPHLVTIREVNDGSTLPPYDVLLNGQRTGERIVWMGSVGMYHGVLPKIGGGEEAASGTISDIRKVIANINRGVVK